MGPMKKILYSILILVSVSCTQEYIPPVKPSGSSWLVIDGSLNSGAGPASLTLSRTTNLDTTAQQYERGATIIIQGDDGSTYLLAESSPGLYTASDLNLDGNKKYRLKINASNGETYASDYVSVIPNPPIDSINYQQNADGLQIFINTHNPQNNTRYYKWQYSETWEFHSAYLTTLKYVPYQTAQGLFYSLTPPIVSKDPPDPYDSSIFACWQSDSSTEILLGSSAALSEDLIHLPITKIPTGSQKMSALYSINILQYGWSEAGYQFLQAMKKNSENTGSFFNPLPSQLVGNIQCISDPSKMAVGYFNISPAQQKRFFIPAAAVTDWNYNQSCPLFEITNNPDSIVKYHNEWLPTVAAQTKPIPLTTTSEILTFNASYPVCVDCTISGTNTKPPYWP